MGILLSQLYSRGQRQRFGKLLRFARETAKLSQLAVAQMTFNYEVSHCKVSRIERGVMRHVDALALAGMANTLGLPLESLEAIDPKFLARLDLAQKATNSGFWTHKAKMFTPRAVIQPTQAALAA